MSTGHSSTKGSIRIMAVDDHPLLRQGIATLIEAEEDMELVAEACDGEEPIAQFRLHRPDATLMDIHRENNDTQLFAQTRTLRIRQRHGFDFSSEFSTSQLRPLRS